jgi:hypothetical protein
MPCTHCKQAGHTYRTCPTMSDEEKKEKAKKIEEEKKEREARRNIRLARQAEVRRIIEARRAAAARYEVANPPRQLAILYEVSNTTDHEVVLYWTNAEGPTILKRFSYANSHSTNSIRCVKDKHRIVGIPFLEVCENNGPNAKDVIHCPSPNEIPYQTVVDVTLKELEGTNIIIDCEYNPPKKEIDQWKECALKSKYLLEQLIKLGGMKYENLVPILDMVQDITIPASCSEIDKEMAGVPSALTNIT